jgi:hypothetical protein
VRCSMALQMTTEERLQASKWGEISTDFEVQRTKSARRVEIDHPEPGQFASGADGWTPFL